MLYVIISVRLRCKRSWGGGRSDYFGLHQKSTVIGETTVKQGSHASLETRAKLSAAKKGRILTPEHRAKIAASLMGNHNTLGYRPSPETRAKLSAIHLGKSHPVSPETGAKISAALKGRVFSDEWKAKISTALLGRKRGPVSEEVRAKMSIARKGRKGIPHTAEWKARMSAIHMGHDVSPEAKAKMSANRKGKGGRKGERHHNWMGGASRLPYAWTFNAELKAEIRRRDGHRCQLCGVSQAECKRTLTVHHVDYNKTNSDPVNLTALCHSCNTRVNANRPHWTAFFQEKALARMRQLLLFQEK